MMLNEKVLDYQITEAIVFVFHLSGVLHESDLWNDSILGSRETRSVLPPVDLPVPPCWVSLSLKDRSCNR